jgi:hypothetical protein
VTPIVTSTLIFGCVLAGALIGMWLRSVLPEHHLGNDTKDLVKLGVGLIGTMSALVLGLLVASAESSYSTRSTELTEMAANVILLDRMLAHYGPEAADARATLKVAVAHTLAQIWPKAGVEQSAAASRPSNDILFDKLQELTPHSDAQRALQAQIEATAISLGQTRWLLFEQNGTSVSTPFLVVVVFWLSILFVSFGLFAPRNATAITTLIVSAISVAGAIFLILELEHPLSGWVQIPETPLRVALEMIGK